MFVQKIGTACEGGDMVEQLAGIVVDQGVRVQW